jgi:hypothetical protein
MSSRIINISSSARTAPSIILLETAKTKPVPSALHLIARGVVVQIRITVIYDRGTDMVHPLGEPKIKKATVRRTVAFRQMVFSTDLHHSIHTRPHGASQIWRTGNFTALIEMFAVIVGVVCTGY